MSPSFAGSNPHCLEPCPSIRSDAQFAIVFDRVVSRVKMQVMCPKAAVWNLPMGVAMCLSYSQTESVCRSSEDHEAITQNQIDAQCHTVAHTHYQHDDKVFFADGQELSIYVSSAPRECYGTTADFR